MLVQLAVFNARSTSGTKQPTPPSVSAMPIAVGFVQHEPNMVLANIVGELLDRGVPILVWGGGVGRMR